MTSQLSHRNLVVRLVVVLLLCGVRSTLSLQFTNPQNIAKESPSNPVATLFRSYHSGFQRILNLFSIDTNNNKESNQPKNLWSLLQNFPNQNVQSKPMQNERKDAKWQSESKAELQKNRLSQHSQQRRRLASQTIDCSNTRTTDINTNAIWLFEPWLECELNPHSYSNNVSSPTIFTDDSPLLLYSNDCQYKLIFNTENGKFEMYPSQMNGPHWQSSNNTDDTAASSSFYGSLSDSGDLESRYSDSDEVFWAASQTNSFNVSDTTAPYSLVLGDDRNILIVDSRNATVWQSYTTISQPLRENEYTMGVSVNNSNLTNTTFDTNVYIQSNNRLYIALTPDAIAQSYATENDNYIVDVTIYSGSAYLGDEILVYTSMPQQYTFSAQQTTAHRIEVYSSDYTFYCRHNSSLDFIVTINPLNSSSTNDSWNLTITFDPWNPCNDGRPVLASREERTCSVTNESDTVMEQLSTAVRKSDASHNQSIAMKAIFDNECVADLVGYYSNHTYVYQIDNITVYNDTIPLNFSYETSCEDYFITDDDAADGNSSSLSTHSRMVNPDWNSTLCQIVKHNCLSFYETCYDYTLELCTCYCPRDRSGDQCESYRSYECDLDIVSARMEQCESMTQADLNAHGRSDYDITLDGDQPCFFVEEHGEITSDVMLSCEFTDGSDATSQVWESLPGFVIESSNQTFEYCIGTENSTFALNSEPPDSDVRVKVFNFARIFNNTFETWLSLSADQWAGVGNVSHAIELDQLPSDWKIGGRVYIEYHLYVGNNRKTVERRFYDIDHWEMPVSNALSTSQIWIIVWCCLGLIVLIYGCWRCNQWCQKLEHEKNE